MKIRSMFFRDKSLRNSEQWEAARRRPTVPLEPSNPFALRLVSSQPEVDVPASPPCPCGKPSASEDGVCADCIEAWAQRLATGLVDAGDIETTVYATDGVLSE